MTVSRELLYQCLGDGALRQREQLCGLTSLWIDHTVSQTGAEYKFVLHPGHALQLWCKYVIEMNLYT